MISAIGHVALQVPNLDDSVRWATTVMGLREVARERNTSYLTHGRQHHSLIYIGAGEGALDHISLEAANEAALDELSDRLAKHGVKTVDHEREPAVQHSIRFAGPDGHLFEVYTGMSQDQPGHTGRGVQPRRFGHPMLKSEHPRETQRFIEEVLGFRLSDDVGDGTLLFLRCNADHHGIGITKGGEGLHHYAWEVESLAALGLVGDVLEKNGGRFLWGPGRHGAGGNLFTYHLDPAGCVVEYYADLIKIYDEANYRPGKWEMSDYRFANLWGPGIPGHEFFDAGAKLPAARVGAKK
jgi:catechol 2,3-dioxygenase-like lactoylglutathione lyase family enzyme